MPWVSCLRCGNSEVWHPLSILVCITCKNHWEARIVMHQHMRGRKGFLCFVEGLFTLGGRPELSIFLKELVEWLKNWAQTEDEPPVVVDQSTEGTLCGWCVLDGFNSLLSLRSKRSRTTRTKFGPREGAFFAFWLHEKWGESRKEEGGGGEGKGGNACPQTPRFLKTPSGFHDWVHLLIDNFVTELKIKKKIKNIRLEGKKV